MKEYMYIIYLRTDRVVAVIGDYSEFNNVKGYFLITRNRHTIARFMLDGIEGYEIKEVKQ